MKFGYTIIYVNNVPETVDFYERVFGLTLMFLHETGLYAEMETGDTILAFAGEEAAEMNNIAIARNKPSTLAAGWELCFITEDVNSSYNKAISEGATPVLTPTRKPWGQTVSYVRDLNGCLVEIASPVER